MKIKDNLKENSTDFPKLFGNHNVRILVLPYNFGKHTLFLSLKNEPFKAVINKGSSSFGGDCHIGFIDLLNRNKYDFYYNNTQGFLKREHGIDFDFLNIMNITNELEEEYLPYPNPRIIESMYKFDEILYIISRPEHDWSYDDFKLDIVRTDGTIMHQVKCNSVERYRDGGTTYFKTDIGTLYQPTAFDKDLKPYWDVVCKTELERISEPMNYLGKEMLELLGF